MNILLKERSRGFLKASLRPVRLNVRICLENNYYDENTGYGKGISDQKEFSQNNS